MEKNSTPLDEQPAPEQPLGIEISADSGAKTVQIAFSTPIRNMTFDVVQAANLCAVLSKAVATLLEAPQVIAPDSRMTGKPT